MRLKDKNIVKGQVISKEEKKRLLTALSYYTSIIFAMISHAPNRIATCHREHA
jgi:hypothetical protein